MKPRKSRKQVAPSILNRYTLQPYTKIVHQSPEGKSLIPIERQGYICDIGLSEERYRFDSTQDPLSCLNIFVKCIEMGFYPPAEALKFISSKFKEYMNTDDTLDSVIGLGKRSKNAYKNSRRDLDIVLEIDTLRHYFNITVEEAIDAVARRYEDNAIRLKDTTIGDIYNRDGKKQLKSGLMILHNDIPWMDEISEEGRMERLNELLNNYPSDIKEFLHKRINTSLL